MKLNRSIRWSISSICLVWVLNCGQLVAQSINLKQAVLLVSPSVPSPMRETAPRVLSEEIEKRTGVLVKTVPNWPKSGSTRIALVLAADKELQGIPVPASTATERPELKPEGYRIINETTTTGTTLWIIGADSRGVLFGAGWVLRNLKMDRKVLELPGPVDVATSPAYPIRGHQLGYRHTANSYDAWTVSQFEQYIRDLAIFGTNAVEGIPFHEDEKPSPHFKIPAAEMRIKVSEICQAYDMDYWVWTPATIELTDAKKRQAELDQHEAFYKACPRLDHIFFPGGDPGENHPRDVMPFLKDLHTMLIKYHPKAKVWLSLQGFRVEQINYFYDYLAQNKPDWLQGLVYGPGSPPLAETRYRLPKQYQLRQYPDITHTVRCEFPVEHWDQAFALTLGREASNPRPYFYARAQVAAAPFTDGFVSYSDGCHDDVNKVLWSMRGWNPELSVHQILNEYSRFFVGWPLTEPVANGIEALEKTGMGHWLKMGALKPRFRSGKRWKPQTLPYRRIGGGSFSCSGHITTPIPGVDYCMNKG
eukprot:TRINITY_DN7503_c0_g1_i2.p1 TRINITY_DN7503_c0_g1~~TRINITY_DN7503_c0_g1_i2.p1  ORF type:complete len:533 (+),score=-56.00 TRINITY_DN7503_c0_g1_i2:296-1894(+)